jgi:hypothetical protein
MASIMILLRIVRFRLGTVIASICGMLAWKPLGEVAFGKSEEYMQCTARRLVARGYPEQA